MEALHPEYKNLIKEYAFQPVRDNRGQLVNIMLVRASFGGRREKDLYNKYKDEILFIGISSFEDFPQPPLNPYSGKYPKDEYPGMFPGFLHMIRNPEKVFPPFVKLLLMSQSDFSLPYPSAPMKKKYDFTFSMSDHNVATDCVGWAGFAKNWSFMYDSLKLFCDDGMKGVLVASMNKQGTKACSLPKNCKKGQIVQTPYIDQNKYFAYVKQSRFAYIPQVHDASPRVTTQALMNDVPLLMNRNIMGGWKYVNDKTGEFFNGIADVRDAKNKILAGIEANKYEPRKWVQEHYGDAIQGKRLLKWIKETFPHRVSLGPHITALFPAGA